MQAPTDTNFSENQAIILDKISISYRGIKYGTCIDVLKMIPPSASMLLPITVNNLAFDLRMQRLDDHRVCSDKVIELATQCCFDESRSDRNRLIGSRSWFEYSSRVAFLLYLNLQLT